MIPDPTLRARLLLSGAAVEIPCITKTVLRPIGHTYFVAIVCDPVDVGMYQWCRAEDLDEVVEWMVTTAWAMQGQYAQAG